MLVLYKQRKSGVGASIGFLDAIFSRATFADMDTSGPSNGMESHHGYVYTPL
jgi:hypothetical protein